MATRWRQFRDSAWDQAGREFGRNNWRLLAGVRLLGPAVLALLAAGAVAFAVWQVGARLKVPALDVAGGLRWASVVLAAAWLVSLWWRRNTHAGRLFGIKGRYRPVATAMCVGAVALFALSTIIA